MNITEDYVSFEIAKLLKEKKFNYPCRAVYSPKGIVKHYLKEELYAHNLKRHKKLCPTLQMAMKWLREVHSLCIGIYYLWPCGYEIEICRIGKDTHISEFEAIREHAYDTYEEACETALKYCLKNLI